jgi:ubiquinol-cytochrome c reductase iron-sulfur subunit
MKGKGKGAVMSDIQMTKPLGRRDFLYVATGALAVVGGGLALWPLVDNMNPSADVLALSMIEVDLAPIEIGQRVTVKWRGRPVFIVRRTAREIAASRAQDGDLSLIDPATDASRVQRPEWLIVIGVCTHLGCIPLGQKPTAPRGEYGGWFCPCHGSEYDTAGRVRRGPAPLNLWLPPYKFLADDKVKIGQA